ncbi:hypothetical protein TNCV_1381741 [Trichonephila clavipes]|nr:hypothetical protein TNCV_1381741 [Trichonephila clavipes]
MGSHWVTPLIRVVVQQDNARSHVDRRILIYLIKENNCCVLASTFSSSLSTIENISSKVAERLGRHCFSAITIDEIWQRQTAWKDFLLSVIQVQFGLMPNRRSSQK